MNQISIRCAREQDAEALCAIYAPYVNETAITFEYKVPTTEEFASRIHRTLLRYPYLVAELHGCPIGYAYAAAFKGRSAYDWSVETSIYVKREHHGSGVGRLLYQLLEQILSAQKICNVNACIASPAGSDPFLSNDSILFHTHMGYRMVGEFHACGYKFDRWYNMVWMEKQIGPHQTPQPAVLPFQTVRAQFSL